MSDDATFTEQTLFPNCNFFQMADILVGTEAEPPPQSVQKV